MDLKLRDRKIIHNLDFNARMSLTQLGKKLFTSKQVVKYRLAQLEKKGIIQGYYADVNASKLGYSIYLIYLKFHRMNPEKELKFMNMIGNSESVGVNASINGRWDHCVGIWASSVVDFKKKYKNVFAGFESFIKTKTIMIETDFYYYKPKQILEEEFDYEVSMTGDLEQIELDIEDATILSLLSQNGRASLVEMAQETKLTAPAIKQRMKKLEKKKVILGYRVMINYQKLGFLHYRIFFHLENSPIEKEKKLIGFLKQQKQIVSVTKTIGYCDMECRAIVKDVQEFYDLIGRARESFKDSLQEYDSILYHKFHNTLNYYPFNR